VPACLGPGHDGKQASQADRQALSLLLSLALFSSYAFEDGRTVHRLEVRFEGGGNDAI
jgi:hypothetical protein